ncbi:hypothetical protein [Kroppenstedtia guangzhouensis]|uniref:hypothetical protein n=1 Tax=Kroppenstedtia guangzhouensis TaxID=1274356 RepID=UPI001665A352|nr:hypothetical protein [Kroppenstedtia guangzhouensis]
MNPKHYEDPEYRKLSFEVQKKFPDDPIAQIQYVEKQGSVKYNFLYLLDVTQRELLYRESFDQELTFRSGTVEYLLRALHFAVSYMDTESDDHFKYLTSKGSPLLLQSLQQVTEQKK